MYQIDVPSAVPARPASTAMGQAGFFTDGNVNAGAAATIVPAEFLNMLMAELLGVLAAGGVAPSKGASGQVAQAISAIVTADLQQSAPAIGAHSAIFPSGFIVNWGGGSQQDNSGACAVTFERPFPTGFIGIACNAGSGPPAAFHGTGNYQPGGAGMTVFSAGSSGVAAQAGTAFFYIAVGF